MITGHYLKLPNIRISSFLQKTINVTTLVEINIDRLKKKYDAVECFMLWKNIYIRHILY